MILFGLKNCDTCRKAVKILGEAGKSPEFLDVRQTPLSRNQLERFHSKFGDQLVNSRSTTWRSLTDEQKNSDPIDLLLDHPALMKRPVIDDGTELTLGWNETISKFWLGR